MYFGFPLSFGKKIRGKKTPKKQWTREINIKKSKRRKKWVSLFKIKLKKKIDSKKI